MIIDQSSICALVLQVIDSMTINSVKLWQRNTSAPK